MLPFLKQFIHDYCEVCPVVEDCLTTATEDDLYYTVRAGRLPLGQSTAKVGRPEVAVKKLRWKAKPPPLRARPGKTTLERGVCTKGLHGILSAGD